MILQFVFWGRGRGVGCVRGTLSYDKWYHVISCRCRYFGVMDFEVRIWRYIMWHHVTSCFTYHVYRYIIIKFLDMICDDIAPANHLHWSPVHVQNTRWYQMIWTSLDHDDATYIIISCVEKRLILYWKKTRSPPWADYLRLIVLRHPSALRINGTRDEAPNHTLLVWGHVKCV